jgi:hypothetical protein
MLATMLGEVEMCAAGPPPRMKRYNLGTAPDTGVPMACVARRGASFAQRAAGERSP